MDEFLYRNGTLHHERPNTGMILGLRPGNDRRRYFVTTSLIG